MTDKDPGARLDEKNLDDGNSEPLQVKFSLPQIAGGALAAATAALIGSQLGVAGTILGAAVASVIGGVAGTLYSAGLDRTHRRVTEAIRRGYERVLDADDVETQVLPAVDATAELPAVGDRAVGTERPYRVPTSGQDAAESTAVDLQPVSAAASDGSSRRRKVLVAMGVSIAAIFVVTMLAITAIELGLGRSLDGSSTTTIGGARRPTATATVPKPTPTRTPSATESQTETPSAAASPTPESTPSASQEVTPESTPSASITPTPAAASS